MGFVVVGLEVFLVVGLVDDLVDVGIFVFGLFVVVVVFEGFKDFMKWLCDKYVIFMVKY